MAKKQMEMEFRKFPAPIAERSDDSSDSMTFDVIAATDAPCMMPDYERQEYVPQVLLMSGVKLPANKRVPLLNTHDRSSADNVLGSADGFVTEDGELRGKVTFSSTESKLATKFREGHVTDFSVGYLVEKQVYVPEGETRNIGGRSFTGPVNVVPQWRVKELSLCPIGADEQCKRRNFDPSNFQRKELVAMKPELKAELVARGMDANLTDEQAYKWLNDNVAVLTAKVETKEPAKKEETSDDSFKRLWETAFRNHETLNKTKTVEAKAPEVSEDVLVRAFQKFEAQKAEAQKKLREDVKTECKRFNLEGEVEGILSQASTIEEARSLMLDKIADRQSKHDSPPSFGRIENGPDQKDKHLAGLKTALAIRALERASGGNQKVIDKALPVNERSEYANNFANHSLCDFARECLIADGIEVRGLTRPDIAQIAMGNGGLVGRSSYHYTASFANLTMDAINKTLLGMYGEIPVTWSQVFSTGADANDFKNINRIMLSDALNVPIWQDTKAIEQVAFTDEKVSYAVEARGQEASFSWQLVINDDLGGLTDIPMMFADAHARTVNAVAWAQITSNPTMPDGQALFVSSLSGNRKSGINLITGSATPTVSTLGSMKKLMRLQKGNNTAAGNASDAILGLEPAFIAAPAALETTVLQLLNSVADPAISNSGAANPFRSSLTPIIEPLLDSSSATAWYLFVRPVRVKTVEVTFLSGYRTPRTNSYIDPKTWALNLQSVQVFNAKVLNHRGAVKHAGA